MDIPNTGAIFTLGKSHLAENTQSYFYIKNDPIKRVISGPHQSAVICESGRLFVWGENRHGQLGIGGNTQQHNGGNNNNNSKTTINNSNEDQNINSNSNNNNKTHCNASVNDDLVTKPTCVKSLKILGLKIADIAFGKNWAIILTHSNEIFFSGCNIFHNLEQNFIETEVAGSTKCSITRKPFRLEKFDDCLSRSEEEENFVSVLAGNEHFAVLTSSGRLLGWGSNAFHQLGQSGGDAAEEINKPLEIILDAPIQQFACGPESTLVLTASGSLYLTGRLNEFVCTQFTVLQKNLAQNEQIIFMHISKTSDIFIVTNTGGIYRSFETVRNKSLIFQRFYDYDSEENGPIWKLLKGFSFYAVLTKAHKFYTTFSESGHHLKTFREISKFKNLRLLDMAVGEEHVLVHGIPRSSTLSAAVGAAGEHRYMSRAFVVPPADINENVKGRNSEKTRNREAVLDETLEIEKEAAQSERKETPRPNATLQEDVAKIVSRSVVSREQNVEEISAENDNTKNQRHDANINGDDVKSHTSCITAKSPHSPSGSLRSQKSGRSIKFEETVYEKTTAPESQQKLRRPRTPYPDSSRSNTPQTAKKTARNFSYEAAMEHDAIANTTPALHDSPDEASGLKRIALQDAHVKTPPTPPYEEEDEELTVEIQTITDELDQTVINEIRFINNGVDVTPTVDTKMLDDKESVGSTLSEDTEETENEGRGLLKKVQPEIGKTLEEKETAADLKQAVEEETHEASDKMGEEVQTKPDKQTKETKETAAHKIATDTLDAVDIEESSKEREAAVKAEQDAVTTNSDKVKKTTAELGQTMSHLGTKALDAAGDAKQTMAKMATDTKQAMSSISSKMSSEMQNARENLSTLLSPASDKSGPNTSDDNESTEIDSAETAVKAQLRATVVEDDERTTASVNSNHTASEVHSDAGNPFEDETPSKNETMGGVANKEDIQPEPADSAKNKVRQFFDDIRSKGKGISCSSEKNIRIDDEPPRYTPVEEFSRNHGSPGQMNSSSNTSKVCTIL